MEELRRRGNAGIPAALGSTIKLNRKRYVRAFCVSTNHFDRSHAQYGQLTRDHPAVVTRLGNASRVRKTLPAGDARESSNWAWPFS
jgi:hypothetical protein